MACLQAGTVLPATVEQALENCLLVCVKHKSRIFRGVLFDEKNAIVWRAPVHDQSTSFEAMKGKITGGSSVSDGASRWSTRQASLFYRRQNNRSFPCRRIPSLFSDVKVLTEADLIKESQGDPKNMEDKSSSITERPSASCDHKTKQEQVKKAKETSGRKTCVPSQVVVKGSKCETSLKRKSSGQDICSRPSKRKPQMVRFVSKGVQKHADNKQTKGECRSPKKTEVGNGRARAVGSKDLTEKSVSTSHYKVLITRPCSVPVVPIGTSPKTGQQRSGTVLVLKKVLPCSHMETNRLPPRKSLESVVTNLSEKGINKNVDNIKVQDRVKQNDKADLEMKQKPRAEERKGESTSERDMTNTKDIFQSFLADNVESGISTDENVGGDNLAPQGGIQSYESKEDSAESKRVNENSLSSGDADCTETQESQTDNTPIKRSARISERRANAVANSLATSKKSLGRENYPEKSNVVKGLDADCKESNDTISKALSHDISNPSAKWEVPVTTTTQHQPLKYKSIATSTNTKYTQRMTWQLQPQGAPIGNIYNPVSVGNIVWGKVHGHPWWPGKVLAISGIRSEDSKNPWDRDAHVSWFGSNTSSIMRLHSLQLFLPNFAKRHKRHKKGFYRVAVREAQDLASQAVADKDCLAW